MLYASLNSWKKMFSRSSFDYKFKIHTSHFRGMSILRTDISFVEKGSIEPTYSFLLFIKEIYIIFELNMSKKLRKKQRINQKKQLLRYLLKTRRSASNTDKYTRTVINSYAFYVILQYLVVIKWCALGFKNKSLLDQENVLTRPAFSKMFQL